ncbi:hypothetical protein [Listeria grandensis]|uniref:hypothetical protein n=1 Tax=Listeria grandensis TaxID=1494963 RepID=UPI001625EA8B|nr:hypothetical protein [Listeria grandensis]
MKKGWINIKVIIYAYPPISIGLSPKFVGNECVIIVPMEMKSFYKEYNQKSIYYIDKFEYHLIISVIQDLMKNSVIEQFIVLSEPDVEFGGFLNDYFGANETGQGLANATLYRNKYIMRSVLNGKVKQPKFSIVDSKESIYRFFQEECKKLILKPLSKDSAEGIEYISCGTDINQIGTLAYPYILEESIEHELMFTTDGICVGDEIVAFFIHQYEEPIMKTFERSRRHITRTCFLDLEEHLREELFKCTQTVINTFNKSREILPFHMEWFYDGENIIFCEAASRFGGKIGTLIQSTYQFDIFEAYWHMVLEGVITEPVKFDSISRPNKVSFNYSAYLREGELLEIPKLERSIRVKVEPGTVYTTSSNIQQNSFEVYQSVSSELMYKEKVNELDQLNQKFIFKK